MLKLLAATSLMVAMSLIGTVHAQQERAPLKTFEYQIKISHLKLEEQSISALKSIKNLENISNPDIRFLDYTLSFYCTNHALQEYPVLEQIKAILSKNGIEIDKVERKLIRL